MFFISHKPRFKGTHRNEQAVGLKPKRYFPKWYNSKSWSSVPDEPQYKRTFRLQIFRGLLCSWLLNKIPWMQTLAEETLHYRQHQTRRRYLLYSSLKCLLCPIIRDSTLGSSIFGQAQYNGFCVPMLCSKRGACSMANGQ